MANSQSTPKAGWKVKRIGDVCDLMTGGTPSRKKPEYFDGGGIRWLVSGDIHQREIHDCDGRISQLGLENSNAKYLPLNSVMIALNGQGKTRGTVTMLRTNATCNQSLVSIFPKDRSQLLPEYIYANLHGRYEEIRRITGDDGNDRRGLNMPLVRRIEIPIPPLPEQERIVGILDEAFEGIATATAQAEKNLHNARELFQSVLQSTFSQKGDDWVETTLGEVSKFSQGIQVGLEFQKTEPQNGYVRFIRIIDYTQQTDDIRYVEDPGTKYLVNEDDLVMVRYGTPGLIGRGIKGVIANNLFKITLHSENLENDYVEYYLSQSQIQNYLSTQGSATMPALTFKQLKVVKVSVPPHPTQQATVEKLDALSEETKHLEAIYERKQVALAELKQSLLRKAFAGEL